MPADPSAGEFTEHRITLDGHSFSYLDSGGDGPPLLALHGHFGRGRIFAPLARALAGRHRVIAPDQRAHGRSDHGGTLVPGTYVDDAAALLEALGLAPAAVLGHSMGGAVAYLLAARRPELVSALIVADGTVLNRRPETEPVLDVSGWPRRAPSREALGAAVEARGIPDAGYFLDSAAEFEDGWGFLFDTSEMMASQRSFVGDFSADWRASRQPALLLHGEESFLLGAETARRMAGERADTELVDMPGCGHWLYEDDPDGFASAVGDFLGRVGG
ncbi:alpha/beta hydrolase [Streptomyces albiaxialis]|uniref:Alpha/beta hydrolase n=1 Tax=Streptomyces albiaxialis TaxID=329523 RepID=A0ABN2WSV8_9ACTN